MKKLLSVVLAVVMMFSISVIAFAADSPSIEFGKEYTVTLENNATEYTFIAPEDGAYRISASILYKEGGVGFANIAVFSDDQPVSYLDLFYWDNSEIDFLAKFRNLEDEDIFMAAKGKEMTVSVESGANFYGPDDIKYPEATVTFKITNVDDLREIKIGESYTVKGEEYFLFKPTEDGAVDLWSHLCQDISVMSLDGTMYNGARDFSTGFPADVAFEYKAGEIYGICVNSDRDEEDNPIDSVFYVVDAKTVQPDVIEFDDITVIWGDTESICPQIYPLGSVYNCGELEYTIENEKIATVEYDPELEMYVIHGRRPGKTTLTVTEPNYGITRIVEVEVITRTTNFFRTVFDFISSIFGFIFER